MTNRQVAEAWANGKEAKNKRRTLYSKAGYLYSYALVIGVNFGKFEGGQKIVYDYTAGKAFISQTTSIHVGLAKQYADIIEEPILRPGQITELKNFWKELIRSGREIQPVPIQHWGL